MDKHTYQKGEKIFTQSDEARTMFEIRSGKVGIYADYQTAKEKQLAVFEENQTFGEMGLIEGCPRSATAVALEDGTVVDEISAAEFAEYFHEQPVQVFLLLKQLSARLRETTKNYVEACQTVSETVETGAKGAERSSWLKERLRFFADVYRGFTGNGKHPADTGAKG